MKQYLCFSRVSIIKGVSFWHNLIVDLPDSSSFGLGFGSRGLYFSDFEVSDNNGIIRWSDCSDWNCSVELDPSTPFWCDAVHFSLSYFLENFKLCLSLFGGQYE